MISLKEVDKTSNIFLLASTTHHKLRQMKNAMERHGYKIALPFPISSKLFNAVFINIMPFAFYPPV
jgi:hypothetical protein